MISILSATIVFVFSQYILKLVLDPIQEHRRAVARVGNWSLRNQHKIMNPIRGDSLKHATLSDEAKGLAADILTTAYATIGYRIASRTKLFGIATFMHVLDAARELNLMSTEINPQNPDEPKAEELIASLKKVGCLLRIPTRYDGTPGTKSLSVPTRS